MRDRPFLDGSEAPRRYSDVRAENPAFQRRMAIMQDIADLEARGEQDEAEEMRDALYHMRRR